MSKWWVVLSLFSLIFFGFNYIQVNAMPVDQDTVIESQASNYSILLLYGDDSASADIVEGLITGHSVSRADATVNTITGPDLASFDLVIIWSDENFLNPVAIGNALADYVDYGGAVIEMPSSFLSNGDDNTIKGRWADEGYSALNSSSATTTAGAYDYPGSPFHQIFDGIGVVIWNQVLYADLSPGASLVSMHQDGGGGNVTTLGGLKGNVLSLNFYIPAGWSGNLSGVLENAIQFIVPLTSAIDEVNPDVSTSNSLITFEAGTLNNKAVWTVGDKYPNVYTIYQNGTPVLEDISWVNGSIEYSLDALAEGYYIFNLTVFDYFNNWNSSLVNVTVTPQLLPPQQPLQLTSTVSLTSVSLSWNAPSSDGGLPIEGYNVYRSTSSGGTFTNIGTTTNLNFEDSSVLDENTYYYQVSAFNSRGESTNSSELEVSFIIPYPSAPNGFAITSSGLSVQLNWSDPLSDGGSVILGYNIYRSLDNLSFSLLGSVTTLGFEDTNVVDGQVYYYKVAGFNTYKEGFNTSSFEYTFIIPLPDAPQNLSAVIVGGEILLVWEAPVSFSGPPIQGYHIYRAGLDGIFTLIGDTTDLNYTDSTVTQGEVYSYKVNAYNNKGDGSQSNVITIEVPIDEAFQLSPIQIGAIAAAALVGGSTAIIKGKGKKK